MQTGLVPVSSSLVQGSLALGSLTQAVLGQVRPGGTLDVHPFLLAGWAGLVGTAFNLLPVGSIDGGRMMLVRPLPLSAPRASSIRLGGLFETLDDGPVCGLPPVLSAGAV